MALTTEIPRFLAAENKEAAKVVLALDQVNNTSDVNKPVSTAQAAADALVQSNAYAADAVVASNAATALARTRVKSYFPEEYGAVGDGTANDTAAIVAMLAAIPATGGEVVLGGRYKITSVTVSKPISFRGKGAGWVTNATVQRGATGFYSDSLTLDCIIVNSNGCSFTDLDIWNTQITPGTRPTAGSGLRVDLGNMTRLTRCVFHGFYDLVHFVNGHLKTVTDCGFYNPVRYGVLAEHVNIPDAGDDSYSGCTFSYYSVQGAGEAALKVLSGGGIKMVNCKINGSPASSEAFKKGVWIAPSDGTNTSIFELTGCSIENVTEAGVHMQRAGTNGTYQFVSIIGGEMANMPIGVRILAGCADAAVASVKFARITTTSIRLDEGATGAMIGVNTHLDCTRLVDSYPTAARCYVEAQTSRATISGNYTLYLDVSANVFQTVIDYRCKRATPLRGAITHRVYTFSLAEYNGGSFKFEATGIVQGVGPVHLKYERSFVREAGAATYTTIGTDIVAGAGGAFLSMNINNSTPANPRIEIVSTTASDIDITTEIRAQGVIGLDATY